MDKKTTGNDNTLHEVLSDHKDGIAHIRLNRPGVLNAVNGALCTGLKAAFAAAEDDASVKVIVLSGKGRAFCGKPLWCAGAAPP